MVSGGGGEGVAPCKYVSSIMRSYLFIPILIKHTIAFIQVLAFFFFFSGKVGSWNFFSKKSFFNSYRMVKSNGRSLKLQRHIFLLFREHRL